jgi:hypothetical protein
MFINNIKNETFLVRSSVRLNQPTLPPNQRLKLTEIAVSFSPHEKNFLGKWQYSPRVLSTRNWLFVAAA